MCLVAYCRAVLPLEPIEQLTLALFNESDEPPADLGRPSLEISESLVEPPTLLLTPNNHALSEEKMGAAPFRSPN